MSGLGGRGVRSAIGDGEHGDFDEMEEAGGNELLMGSILPQGRYPWRKHCEIDQYGDDADSGRC
jgi:hypothetical protein